MNDSATLPEPAASASSARGKTRVTALIVACGLFMQNLDGTVIVTALPQMAKTFGVSPVDLGAGISAYLMTLALLIPASGWLADRMGARTVFVLAIVVFGAASVLCGFSQGVWQFVAARVLQGAGGAMMVPVGRLVVLRHTEKHQLMRAIAALTWPSLVGPILGPPLGGFITTYATWRWIFFLNVPLVVAGALCALWLVPNQRGDGARQFDWLGFGFTGLACLGCMVGLEALSQQHIAWFWAAAILSGSVVLGVLAIRHAQRHPSPLLVLAALRVHSFLVTCRGGALFRIAINAVPFLLPLLFQVGFGLNAFTSGLLVLSVFAGNLTMKPATSAVLRHFGFRRTLFVNGTLVVLTLIGCAAFSPAMPWAVMAAVMFVSGLCRSMQFTSLNTLAFADVPEALMSGANTLFSMAERLPAAVGIATGAVALRLASLLHAGQQPGLTLADFHIAFAVCALIALASLVDIHGLAADAGAAISHHRRSGR